MINGIEFSLTAGSSIVVHPDGTIRINSSPANDAGVPVAKVDRKIGDKMDDGTIYAGESPDSGEAMYVMLVPNDLAMTFNEAKQYADQATDSMGKKGFRLLALDEMKEIYKHKNKRSLKGAFNLSSNGDGVYWSSTIRERDGTWLPVTYTKKTFLSVIERIDSHYSEGGVPWGFKFINGRSLTDYDTGLNLGNSQGNLTSPLLKAKLVLVR